MLKKEEIIQICKEIMLRYEVLTEIEDIYTVETRNDSIDSLTYVTVLMEIEENFNITFPDEYLAENVFSNIDSLIGLIQELISK